MKTIIELQDELGILWDRSVPSNEQRYDNIYDALIELGDKRAKLEKALGVCQAQELMPRTYMHLWAYATIQRYQGGAMTVNQLIAKLQKYDGDMEVRLFDKALLQEYFINRVYPVKKVVYLAEVEAK